MLVGSSAAPTTCWVCKRRPDPLSSPAIRDRGDVSTRGDVNVDKLKSLNLPLLVSGSADKGLGCRGRMMACSTTAAEGRSVECGALQAPHPIGHRPNSEIVIDKRLLRLCLHKHRTFENSETLRLRVLHANFVAAVKETVRRARGRNTAARSLVPLTPPLTAKPVPPTLRRCGLGGGMPRSVALKFPGRGSETRGLNEAFQAMAWDRSHRKHGREDESGNMDDDESRSVRRRLDDCTRARACQLRPVPMAC